MMADRFGLATRWIVGALLAGSLVEVAITIFSAWFPNAGGGYGAPIEVGHVLRVPLLSAPEPMTFDAVILALDIAIATSLFLVTARWSGLLGVALATIGALASLGLFIGMALSGLPIAGLPIPLFGANPLSPSLVLWLDMVFWAGAVAGIVRWRRQRSSTATSMRGA
jgi:hypothetical protein